MKNPLHISSIRLLSISTTVIAVLMITTLFIHSSDPMVFSDKESELPVTPVSSYAIHAFPIPQELIFANEQVPLNKTYVRESFDREILVNTYWQSQTLLLIKRANRYFPVIEPILKEQGIPDDFKYVALIESGLMPRSVSGAGAAGMWQILETTAKEYGLEVTKEVDERYHLEKSTVVACRYMKKAYDKFGSWTLAAASYNAGVAGINRHLVKQKANSYYDLLLGEETGRYVFRILAIKKIIETPHNYGFIFTDDDLYKPIECSNIEVNNTIADLTDFAIEHNITYRELKDMNPWLRESFLNNTTGKTYAIKIPKPGAFIVE